MRPTGSMYCIGRQAGGQGLTPDALHMIQIVWKNDSCQWKYLKFCYGDMNKSSQTQDQKYQLSV